MARKFSFLICFLQLASVSLGAGESERLFKCTSPGMTDVIAILEGKGLLPIVNINLYRSKRLLRDQVQCIAQPTLVRKATGLKSLEIHCGPERVELAIDGSDAVSELTRFQPEGVLTYACQPTE